MAVVVATPTVASEASCYVVHCCEDLSHVFLGIWFILIYQV